MASGQGEGDERGSAVSEFVLLALPLFIPLIILFNSFNATSAVKSNQEMIVRQLLFAFTSSSDDASAYRRMDSLLAKYKQADQKLLNLAYQVRCQSLPCITPGSAVEITLLNVQQISGIPGRESVTISTKAKGYVAKWS